MRLILCLILERLDILYKKHLILGIGIGIFLSSLVFFSTLKFNSAKANLTAEIDDDYIIEKATDMGMIFFDSINFSNEKSVDESTESSNAITSDNYVYIYIPKNSTAVEVADALEKEGLIEDKVVFTNYLIDANLTRKLHFGTFLIAKDATDEEIVNMLTN